MGSDPNKLSQFWQELKRRKVFRVMAMYAATAFIIIEAGDIILPRLGLPDWTVTFIIVLLIIGFPISLILSWIFDLTPEGVKKTGSIEEAKKLEATSIPAKRNIKLSDVIIFTLIVIVGFLVYPKIFNKDKFEGIRDPDGKISIAVMPFENLSGDTLYNVWQSGFQNLLISELSNSEELAVRQYQTMYSILESNKTSNYASITPSIASKLASNLQTRTFILGKILKAGKKIRLNVQLVNTGTEEVYKTYQVEGKAEDDVFILADSLSGLIRNYLEIKKMTEELNSPVIRESIYTNSSEAYRYFIHGWDAFMDLDFQIAIKWLSMAIETDSNFIMAYGTMSYTYMVSGNDRQAKYWCNKVYTKRDELPLKEKLMIDHLHAYYFAMPNEEINYLKQFLEIDELNPTYWYLLGLAYYQKLENYEDAIINLEKALEIHRKWGSNYRNPWIYACLGNSYHKVNDHKREKEVFEMGLSIFPDYTRIIEHQAACALSQGEKLKADELIAKYISITKNNRHWAEARIFSGVGNIYAEAGLKDKAEDSYRQGLNLDPENPSRMNSLAWFLINNDVNIDDGIKIINKALKLEPDNWYYLDTKGWGLYKQGRYEESQKILNGSWHLRPYYNHAGYQHILEVEKALANQNQ